MIWNSIEGKMPGHTNSVNSFAYGGVRAYSVLVTSGLFICLLINPHQNAIYTVSQKNDNDVAHYNFNAH